MLLDTDIYSEILKEIDARVRVRAAAYLDEHGVFTVSAVTVMEIVRGLRRIGSPERAARFLARLRTAEVLPLDAAAAELAGQIAADLERTGQPIGRADPMIAAIALVRRLPLVTGNTAHYRRIRALGYGLELDDWRL